MTKLRNRPFILLLFICVLSSLGACKSKEESNQVEAKPAENAIADVEYIANTVSSRIEGLKNKYPHLASFSTSKNLRKPQAGELYSINYHNGILGQKPIPKDGKKRSSEDIFDPETGVRLNVYFFTGLSRGADARMPQKIGDLSVHLYVKGLAKEQINADIQQVLDKLKNEYRTTTQPAH